MLPARAATSAFGAPPVLAIEVRVVQPGSQTSGDRIDSRRPARRRLETFHFNSFRQVSFSQD